MGHPRYSSDEIVRRGQEWYEREIRSKVEEGNKGKNLIIDIETGDYDLDDDEFGLCFLRIPTWAPFPLMFYCNGHNWLARQLQREGIACTQIDNTFVSVADPQRAQALADRFPVERLHRLLDRVAASWTTPNATRTTAALSATNRVRCRALTLRPQPAPAARRLRPARRR